MKRFLASHLVRYGLVLFVVGCGPLLAIIAAASLGLTSDPNPNPVGPGLLAMVTFWPSIVITGIGVYRVARSDAPPSADETMSLGSVFSSPIGRAGAAVLGLWLVQAGARSLGEGGRGPASALILGAVCLWFCVAGRLPTWFRR
jgi:hypothetical protein